MTLTPQGYMATKENGILTVHNVPIFVECERGELLFDGKWIAEAVENAKQGEREGYFPPLHIRHHEPSTEMNDGVRAAGFFRVVGTTPITFKGARKTAIMADLVITDEGAQYQVMNSQLPYRSVEIPRNGPPSIRGLALLDHEAPFLQLPMLMISSVKDEEGQEADCQEVALASFRSSWSLDATRDDQPMVACFSDKDRACLLFEETMIMTDEEKRLAAEKLKADGDGKKDDTENMEGDGGGDGSDAGAAAVDVSAIVKAIESGEISVKDMDAILSAIQAQEGGQEPDNDEATMANTPASAAAPGAEAMKDGDDRDLAIQFAALKGENEALKGRLDASDAEKLRTKNVSDAMTLLKDRPLGADLEARLVNFHTKHGAEAFTAYVEEMAKTTGVLPSDNGKAIAFAGQNSEASVVAMKYQDGGADSVEKAMGFSAIWRDLKARGMTRKTEEEYVQINMAMEQTA